MAHDIDIMVIPSTVGPPRFLMQEGGTWRNMGVSSRGSRAGISMQDIQRFVQQQLKQLMVQVEHHPPPADAPILTELYTHLYQLIIPENLQELLQCGTSMKPEKPKTIRLHVSEDFDWIPWEIMLDQDDFLGMHFLISRLPITEAGPNVKTKKPRKVTNIHNLLGGGVLNGVTEHAELHSAWETMFEPAMEATAEVTRIPVSSTVEAAEWPNTGAFKKAMTADIVHLTCHGLTAAEMQARLPGNGGAMLGNSPCWILDMDQLVASWYQVSPSLIKGLNLYDNMPLVFGNACASAAGGNTETELGWGFGQTLYTRGAIAFVGTIAPVRIPLAIAFASEFYRRLLAHNLPIAEALWETRWHFRDAKNTDPSYLFYCLYGSPDTRFQLV